MIRTSEKIGTLSKALAAFQGVVEPLTKDAKNPHLKNRYASLAGIVQAIQPLLSEYGLVITQAPQGADGLVGMTTRVIEADSAEWIESTILIPLGQPGPGRNLAQEVGSTLSYLRRYTLLAALGLVIDDDDDGAAGQRPPTRRPAATKKPATKKPSGNGKTAKAEELFPEEGDQTSQAYWDALGPTERGCYRSWDNVRGAIGDLERYKSPQAVTGVIKKLFPGFTENGYPIHNTARAGQIRVQVYRTVKAYAGLRDEGVDGDRAKVLAFDTAKNIAHA